MKHSATIPSPVGVLVLEVSMDSLCKIELLPPEREMDLETSRLGKQSSPASDPGKLPRKVVANMHAGNSVTADVIDQLGRYFEDPEWHFELPLAPGGTPFQRRVWQALQSIPSGVTMSYGVLASRLGTSARAVGNACRRNPIPIVIPCHRVISAHGPGGFMGSWTGRPLAIKKWLLTHETLHDRSIRKAT
uniref:methylated-DNA--[protein]-cysteine S-methyltransferase n=1 Tax=Candidatus Kentrum sp. LFY TaxID=2126342 RepID=A0A450UR85_9GAMM|nr:MAG: methylated-DNA-[protein]-cysteine S-methyltransferase [Candidatus Kentron sp. LFY]